MLYHHTDELSPQRFMCPGSEYRAAPFWAWNNKLDKAELQWQIGQFKKMGFGGFFMHVRTGLETEYLSDEFMEAVDACVKKAKQEKLLAWAYDEDRWPSGAAGGLVTRNTAFRARHLLLTRSPYSSEVGVTETMDSSARTGRTENGSLLACFDVVLGPDGCLKHYRRIADSETPKGFKLYAYEEYAADSPWYNNQAYLDTLNPEAVRAFIEVTHERYLQCEGEEFGKTIPAIFTDEPQFARKETLAFAHETKDVVLPWTGDLPQTYQAAYGEDLLAHLPELLWELPPSEGPSLARYHYHDHVAERFAAAFADQCGKWCEENNLMLTGHMMEEPSLESQTAALGEAMRSYRAFQLPGIDILCDRREFTTAKQAQSAARQYGRPGVLSELYGVTNWDFDFRGHKLQGDWQAALGITVRVPHLAWAAMAGEAKRDYPASISYQSPWHEKYSYIEDHFARVNTALTRGKAMVKIGVIHPVESYWLHWGPGDATGDIRHQMDNDFENLADWLLTSQLDYDYICESLLPSQCDIDQIASPQFPVGEMQYQVLVLPALETIRESTIKRIEQFIMKGGQVICLGRTPAYVDGKINAKELDKLGGIPVVPYERIAVLNALAHVRELEIRTERGMLSNRYVHQLRQDGEDQWLFLAKAGKPDNKDVPITENERLVLNGCYAITEYDTFSGATQSLLAEYAEGKTVLHICLYEEDSLLLKLTPLAQASVQNKAQVKAHVAEALQVKRFLSPVSVTLHEPNVLLLDMAEYALDDEPLQPKEEILRLDNVLRQKLNWPLRGGAIVQPWSEPSQPTPHTLRLSYTFKSELEIVGTQLALENAHAAQVMLNGIAAGAPDGWYVDKSIKTMALPNIIAGENTLEVRIPYGKKANPEAMYLLGDFAVFVQGANTRLAAPVRSLAFGDITTQGLPFYGGNITYHLECEAAGDTTIQISKYRGSLLEVNLDGTLLGPIIFSPYTLHAKNLRPGAHQFDVCYYGTRVNTFGQVHHNTHSDSFWWWGPESWRTKGVDWSYEYHLWPQGILKSPEIF